MHIAVEKGAPEGKPFVAYVKHLHDEHWLPPNAEPWVDSIRNVANEANHEIVVMRREDAESLLVLTDSMLQHIYELPKRLPPVRS